MTRHRLRAAMRLTSRRLHTLPAEFIVDLREAMLAVARKHRLSPSALQCHFGHRPCSRTYSAFEDTRWVEEEDQ